MDCPRCKTPLTLAALDWRCDECGYQMSDDAHRAYRDLVAAYERDADEFFAWVRDVRDHLRSLRPAWQRSL